MEHKAVRMDVLGLGKMMPVDVNDVAWATSLHVTPESINPHGLVNAHTTGLVIRAANNSRLSSRCVPGIAQ